MLPTWGNLHFKEPDHEGLIEKLRLSNNRGEGKEEPCGHLGRSV